MMEMVKTAAVKHANQLFSFYRPDALSVTQPTVSKHWKLETCIDDERQFKTAKRPQAPSNAIVRKWFFRFLYIFYVVDRKE